MGADGRGNPAAGGSADFADITETLNFSELMHRTRGGVDQPSPLRTLGSPCFNFALAHLLLWAVESRALKKEESPGKFMATRAKLAVILHAGATANADTILHGQASDNP